ncbi:MAG: 16S rRNA (cytidine(1402)-2'-O)-methyltransferase [Christensenellales bacterium]
MLYIVATPIGNLEDITLRALRVLKEVDFIAAEDTRRTIKLLNHYNIKTKLVSFHEHSDQSKRAFILEELKAGKNVALVSDAGTPLISDPGAVLVTQAIAQGIEVTSLPGACAAVVAMTLSGLCGPFNFAGFLPKKAGERKKQIDHFAKSAVPVVIYETPHMLFDTLEAFAAAYGPDRRVIVAKELTKIHESVFRGTVSEACKEIGKKDVKGEYVLILSADEEVHTVSDSEIEALLKEYIALGMTKKDAVKAASEELGISKNRAYQLTIKLVAP